MSDSLLKTPLTSLGASFTTHRLTRLRPGVLAYQADTMAHIFYGVFLILGWSCALVGLCATVLSDFRAIILVAGGVAFAALGNRLKSHLCGRKIIDSHRQQITLDIDPIFGRKEVRVVAFSEIELLQLISKRVSDSDMDYIAYELNLVLGQGERVNILAHSNGDLLQNDAREIAGLIGCDYQMHDSCS